MFDQHKPLQTRSGKPVLILRRHSDMIIGCVPDGHGGSTKLLWNQATGKRLDALFTRDPFDLVNKPAVYSDEHIRHWGDIYLKNGLHDLGVMFDTFLAYPEEILNAVNGGEHKPLLPKQRQVLIEQLDDAIGVEAGMLPRDARLQGEGYVEPIKHHRYSTSRARVSRCA